MILIKLQENAKNIGVAVKGYFSLSGFFSYLSSSGFVISAYYFECRLFRECTTSKNSTEVDIADQRRYYKFVKDFQTRS